MPDHLFRMLESNKENSGNLLDSGHVVHGEGMYLSKGFVEVIASSCRSPIQIPMHSFIFLSKQGT